MMWLKPTPWLSRSRGVLCLADHGSEILRMVRRAGVLRRADWLRFPETFPVHEAPALIMDVADPGSAQDAIDFWLIQEFRKAGPAISQATCNRLWWMDRFFQGLVGGLGQVMQTELGYASVLTDPSYQHNSWPWDRWRSKLQTILMDQGNRIAMTGNMGAGKTHLAFLAAEIVLESGAHVIANMGQVAPKGDDDAGFASRIHHAVTLSAIIRLWAEAPEGTHFLVVVDEPESMLRGSSSRAVKHWSSFANFLRKMHMVVWEIWHDETEIYRNMREGRGPRFYRVQKDAKATLSIRHEERVQHIYDVPSLSHLTYDDEDTGTLTVDVDMGLLMHRLSNLPGEAARKAAALAALEDEDIYLEGFGPEGSDASGPGVEPTPAEEPRTLRDVLDEVLADPDHYRNQRGSIDPDLVRLEHGVSHRDAQAIAKRANALQDAPESPGGEAREPGSADRAWMDIVAKELAT